MDAKGVHRVHSMPDRTPVERALQSMEQAELERWQSPSGLPIIYRHSTLSKHSHTAPHTGLSIAQASMARCTHDTCTLSVSTHDTYTHDISVDENISHGTFTAPNVSTTVQ